MNFLILVALLPAFLNAEYTKLQWTDCGSRQVEIFEIAVTPMPILQPGNIKLTFRANFKRALTGNLRTTLDIKRTVTGLTIPIRCYLAAGIYVGSCTYDDLCKLVQTLLPDAFNPSTCPPALAEYGIDCRCPFNIKSGLIPIIDQEFEVPDAQQTIATFLASGDFDIKIDSEDAQGKFGCVQIKFSVKPSKPGK